MNNRLKKIAIFLAVLLTAGGLFGAGMAFGAGGAEPGTQGDPIVTLSYLDSRLKTLEQGLTGSDAGSGTGSGNEDRYSSGKTGGFEKIGLIKGQRLSVSDGGLVVVYTGTGRIGDGTGFLNMTTGDMFEGGTTAVLYSMLLAVGEDSSILASGNMSLYVAGGYSVD